jgi:Fe2+ or Zn2+ uptake regulation protein
MSSTSRDKIYAVIHRTDSIRLTVSYVQEEADENLSKYTVRNTLNGLTEEDVLSHKDKSPYWYVK